MRRREFLKQSVMIGAAAAFPLNRWIPDFRASRFKSVRRNVGVYVNKGGTIGWLLNKDARVIVDSQYPETAKDCIAGVKEKTDASPDMLINTHHHGDHVSGNPLFKEEVSKIIGHEEVPALMRQAAAKKGVKDMDSLAVPDTTYSSIWQEQAGDENIILLHHGPAHTAGDSVVYFEKAGVAHMGDLIFNRAYPYIDRPAGASIKKWIYFIDRIKEDLPRDTIYIFGHANPEYSITGNRGDLIRMSEYLLELLNYTMKGINARKTREEIANTEVLKGFEDFNAPGWGISLSSNIKAAFDEIKES